MYIFRQKMAVMMLASLVTGVLFGSCILGAGVARAETLSVAGEWRYRLDLEKVGLKEGWSAQTLPGDKAGVSGTLPLPGTLDTAGVAPNKE
ncbi:MAG: hypothetical protein WCH57_12430, partial [Verrucomicrobiota bacterium]